MRSILAAWLGPNSGLQHCCQMLDVHQLSFSSLYIYYVAASSTKISKRNESTSTILYFSYDYCKNVQQDKSLASFPLSARTMEVIGLAFGAISLATLFQTCIECYESIDRGRTYSREIRN